LSETAVPGRSYVLAAAVAVGLTGLYFVLQPYKVLAMGFSNLILVACSLVAVVAAAQAISRYGSLSHISLCFAYFFFGLLLWFLGETTWAIYAFWLGVEIPYPSVADFFWFAGYPLVMLALATYPRVFRVPIETKRLG